MLKNASKIALRTKPCRRYVSDSKSTVDFSEVEKFKQLGTNWWSNQMKVLQSMNKLRVPFIRDGLINTGIADPQFNETDRPLSGLKILDVGCGGGFLSEPIARLGAKTTGIDATENLISKANSHKAKDRNLDQLNYIHVNIEDFSANNKEAFDAVVCSEVIEHVVEKKKFLEECVKCLKPKGSIFLTTINQTLMANILAIFVAENVLKIVPQGTHQQDKFISPHSLQRLLEECNCSTRRIHGCTVNPITGEWCWIDNTQVNYALHAVKNKAESGV